MGLNHYFVEVSFDYFGHRVPQNAAKISVPDELIRYFSDSFNWIKTTWNNNSERNGLNYYGYCTICGDELRKFAELLNVWRRLFLLSPNEIILTTGYSLSEKQYLRTTYSHEEVISLLNDIIALTEKTASNNNKILYLGI